MHDLLRRIVRDCGWIDTGRELLGNIMFFAGGILFLPQFEEWKRMGVGLLIAGSFFMLPGAVGSFAVKLLDAEHSEL